MTAVLEAVWTTAGNANDGLHCHLHQHVHTLEEGQTESLQHAQKDM